MKTEEKKRIYLLVEIQDFHLNFNDLRILHFCLYLKNILSIIHSKKDKMTVGMDDTTSRIDDTTSRIDEIAIVPMGFQFADQVEKYSESLSQLFKNQPLGLKFSCLELISRIITSHSSEKKSVIISNMIQALQNSSEYQNAVAHIVCNYSSQYHFKMALEEIAQSQFTLCCIQSCSSSFQTRTNNLDLILESVYEKLVEKVIGSDDKTTRKLARSKFHLLFYSVKKTKILELDQQLESNETGIHLQYSIARIEGIKKYLQHDTIFMESDKSVTKSDLDLLFDQFPKSSGLYTTLEKFEEKLLQSIYEPSCLVSYASSLSKLVSSLYYHLRIKGEDFDTQKVRWFLFEKSLVVLSTILKLFHVEPIEQI